MPCGQTADDFPAIPMPAGFPFQDRKSTRLNSSHSQISYAVFCLKKKKKSQEILVQIAEDQNVNTSPRLTMPITQPIRYPVSAPPHDDLCMRRTPHRQYLCSHITQ